MKPEEPKDRFWLMEAIAPGSRDAWYKTRDEMRAAFPVEVNLATERLTREGLTEVELDDLLVRTWSELKATSRCDFPSQLQKLDSRIILAHRHSSNHRSELTASTLWGCFYCCVVYPPTEVKIWADNGQTAICPHCGIDSVIGSASGFPMTEEFLREMYVDWFGKATPPSSPGQAGDHRPESSS